MMYYSLLNIFELYRAILNNKVIENVEEGTFMFALALDNNTTGGEMQ